MQRFETQYQLRQRTLAAAGLTNQGTSLTGGDFEADIIHCFQHAATGHWKVATYGFQCKQRHVDCSWSQHRTLCPASSTVSGGAVVRHRSVA